MRHGCNGHPRDLSTSSSHALDCAQDDTGIGPSRTPSSRDIGDRDLVIENLVIGKSPRAPSSRDIAEIGKTSPLINIDNTDNTDLKNPLPRINADERVSEDKLPELPKSPEFEKQTLDTYRGDTEARRKAESVAADSRTKTKLPMADASLERRLGSGL